MGNYLSTKAEIKTFILARTPLVIIDSVERERVERMLRELAEELNITIGYYTESRQVCNINGEGRQDVDHDPLPFVADLFLGKRRNTFAFGDVKRLSDDNMYSRELLNILYLARESDSTLILITPERIWPRIAQFGMLTRLDLPDQTERETQLKKFAEMYGGRFRISWTEDDIHLAATLMGGFTEIQMDNILAAALVSRGKLDHSSLTTLASQKGRLYAAVAGIQEVHLNERLVVDGLEILKKWLDERRSLFFASDEELRKWDLTAPKGILLTGVPGCGKSLSAKLVAQQWGLPLYRFDLGTIYDKWVGESEKRMKDALQFIDNVSPCIVWIDEIEKALSVSDAGNDVGKRVLGQFLFWLQESRSRVFLVATANDIRALPFELFRKGRFSEIFFLDLPSPSERAAVIRHYSLSSLHIKLPDDMMLRLVEASAGFSYSDIEYAVKDVAQMALVSGRGDIDVSKLEHSLQSVVSISRSNPERVARIQEWGRAHAVAASSANVQEDGK